MSSQALRTKAIVLRRTNYGESDRILNLLTPEGRVDAMAKGVRKEKSKLAGGIEIFSLADVVVHYGRSSLGILTSAKMLYFYSNIMTDMARLELASTCMKRLYSAAEQVNNAEHFSILQQVLAGLDQNLPIILVETWFWFNLARTNGEEVNLIYDINGEKLDPKMTYFWQKTEKSLQFNSSGDIKAREIKLARLILERPLTTIAKIDGIADSLPPLLGMAQSLN